MVPETIRICVPGTGDRLTLEGRRYVGGRAGPRLLVTAGLHGNEVNAVAALWGVEARLRNGEGAGSVTVFPCVNPPATAAKLRRIPGEDTDLNRFFPGNPGGYLAERIAAALVALLEGHDALVDVHTTGWSVPHVLVDGAEDAALGRRLLDWAAAAGVPVVREMAADLASLQGLDRSWSAAAVGRGKPALTVELPGFLKLRRAHAGAGTEVVLTLLKTAADVGGEPASRGPILRRLEVHGASAGLFEAVAEPGDHVGRGQALGSIRAFDGGVVERVLSPAAGVLLVLQSGSAVGPGSWLATVGAAPQ